MEEPSLESPQSGEGQGEGTPISAISAASASPGDAAGAAPGNSAGSSRGQEASSYAGVLAGGPPAAEAAADPQATSAAAGGAAPYGQQHPSADGHMVWTNEDGDIDALPWDMGGWSTGSSAQQAAGGEEEEEAAAGPQQQQPERLQRQQADPVDEDALIGALRRKVCRLPGMLAGMRRLAG